MRKLTLILTALAIGLYACRKGGEEEITGELVLNELQANSTGDAVVLSWTWNGEGQLDSVIIYLDNSKVGKVTSGNTYTHTTTQTGTYKLIGYVKDKSFESNTRSTTPVSSSVTVEERNAPGPSGLVVGSDYKFVAKYLNDADAPQKVYYYYTNCLANDFSSSPYYLSSPVNGACPSELSGFTITSYIKEDPSFNGVVTDPGNSTYAQLNSNSKYALKFTISGKVYYALATTGASVGSSVTLNFKVQTIPNLRIIGQ